MSSSLEVEPSLPEDSDVESLSGSEVQDSPPSLFRAGHYPCPACSVVLGSAGKLAEHATAHNAGVGQNSIRVPRDALSELGYVGCPNCSRFFRERGLTTHLRSCDVRTRSRVDAASPPLPSDPAWLPSVDELFSTNRPTRSFVPAGDRQCWGRVLGKELQSTVFHNTPEAWTRLLMLPKCVLVAPKRGGKRNRGSKSVSELCDAWERGDLQLLWERAHHPDPPSKSRSVDSKRSLMAAIQHARHGRLGKACAALSSTGLAPDTPSTLDKLRAKHPQAEPPDPLDLPSTPPLQLSSDFDLRGALTSFAKDVGTDGTGFRVQHLLDALEANLPTPVLTHIRAAVNLLLAGKAAEETRPFIAGARLTALAKGSSDIRPIAAGNILRRLASKCACALLQARARSTLGPVQVGVAQPAGAEHIVHSMRSVLASHWHSPDFVVLKVDFANAFNSISRTALLAQCRALFPDLLPWVQWCYGDQPFLFHSLGVLRSCVGVQQGDPLGPLLFCLVLHVLVRKIQTRCPGLALHKWYLDDGVLAGSAVDVIRALDILQREGLALGLHLNLGKCELFSSDADNFDLSVHDAHSGAQLCFPASLHERSTSPNFVLLGSPIGDVDFCTLYVEKLRAANATLLERLSHLEDPQVALHLLRTCASFAKFVYVARTTPPHLVRDSLLGCDEDIRSALASVGALRLTDSAWEQAQLALTHGGLGLRSVSRHCGVAYISSHARSLPELTAELRQAVCDHEDMLSVRDGDRMGDPGISLMFENPPSQRKLSAKLDKLASDELLTDCTVGDRLRLCSVSSPRSAAWLQAMPCRGPFDLTLTPDEMQVLLKHRLGLVLVQPGDCCPIGDCGTPLDILGHHQLTCSKGGYVVGRHNRLRDAFFKLAQVAGLSPSLEQGAFDSDRTRPADVLVQSWSLGKPAAFDLTVVSPHVKENMQVAGDIDVVDRAAELKHANNDSKCDALGWLCVPLAVDLYGRWGEEAHSSFSTLAGSLAVTMKLSVSVALNSIYNTLGLTLARQNARALLARRCVRHSLGAREVRHLGHLS